MSCAYDCACDWAYDARQNQAICSLISKYQSMSFFKNSQEVDNQKPEHVLNVSMQANRVMPWKNMSNVVLNAFLSLANVIT